MNKNNSQAPVHLIVMASMTTTVTSMPYDIRNQDNCSVQLNFTGAPVGTFYIQGSVDYQQVVYPPNPGNWINLVLNPTPIASGAPGNILLDMNQLSFPWFRIQYVPASGTGTLDAYVSTKVV